VPFIPFVGQVKTSPATDPNAYLAKFSHAKEKAAPGSYEVALDSGIKVDLTVTQRTGFGTFTYPASPDATMIINASRNAAGVPDGETRVEGDKQISGSIASGEFCGARNKYKLYFVAEFDRPFKSVGTWQDGNVIPGARAIKGAKTGAYVTFDTTANRTVQVKIGLSYVSTQNASLNLGAENPGWNFTAVKDRARARWNEALRRIEVNGGANDEKQIFYTALYHTLLHPNVFSDANGEYIGFDNRVHKDSAHTQYTNFPAGIFTAPRVRSSRCSSERSERHGAIINSRCAARRRASHLACCQ
jgi:putative alpha-1,2-mannosidase